jgi:hypothetical protein
MKSLNDRIFDLILGSPFVAANPHNLKPGVSVVNSQDGIGLYIESGSTYNDGKKWGERYALLRLFDNGGLTQVKHDGLTVSNITALDLYDLYDNYKAEIANTKVDAQ